MTIVTKYDVLFYGGTNGSGDGLRAQIRLYDEAHKALAYVRFYDRGSAIPVDFVPPLLDTWRVHLPSDMFGSVLDVLRNEKPVQFYTGRHDRTYLGTLPEGEEIGEGEGEAMAA